MCLQCEHAWKPIDDALAHEPAAATKPCLFLSYGREPDGEALADRLCVDLAAQGFDVWRDTREIVAGQSWQHQIADGLRKAQVVIYLMTPHSTRVSTNRDSHDQVDSVCLGEIAYALFHPPPQPVVPVLAARGAEPPLAIFHLDYVDLQAWKQSADQYQAGLHRLLDGIAAALRGEKRYRKWHHQLNPWDFAALLNEKRADFCGREWLFDEIDAWRATRQERALLITGDPGVGKSALVAQLVFLNPGGQVLAYHCCQADTPETLRPARFVRSVAAMIAGKLPEYAARLDDPTVQEALSVGRCEQDPASAFEEGILAQLEYVPAPADGVRYLLIDALDEALAQRAAGLTIVDLLASRLGRLPGWLRIVATTRKEPAVLDRLRGLQAQSIDAEDLRNRADLVRFLARRLQSPNLTALLAGARLSPAQASERLLDKSAGNFLYLKQVLAGLEQGDIDLASLDQLPPGLAGWYLRFFQRHFPDAATYAGAREVLAVLVAAQEPLTRAELARVVRLGLGDSLGRVLRQLASFLRELPGPAGAIGLTLYHKSLADWLTDASLDGSLHHVGLEPGHIRLAEAGWNAYRQGVSYLWPYMLRHLPLHLTHSRRWDVLVRADPDSHGDIRRLFDGEGCFVSSSVRISNWDTNTLRMQLALLEPGTFWMGSPVTEEGRRSNEGPRHEVQISYPFRLARHLATVQDFQTFVNDTGYLTEAERHGGGSRWTGSTWQRDPRSSWRNPGWPQAENSPVVCVTWNDAEAFCAWLSKKEQRSYRLPSEAEWEYACRAGTVTPYHCGATLNSHQANVPASVAAVGRPTLVGSYPENAFGLFDMHGNVWEWCADGYAIYPPDLCTDPFSPATEGRHIIRGGSWLAALNNARSAFRAAYPQDFENSNLGFRIAIEIERH